MKKKLVVALSVVLSAAMLMSGCGGSLPADFDFGFDFDLLSGTFGGESDADDAEVDEEDDDLNSTDVVQFQDCLVERCVRMSLGKKAGEEVTVGECKKLESLVIDTKYDTSLDIDFTSATMECLPCNYFDFSDFQYLTGLKELDIDNFYAFDLIVNMDALSNCKKLEKLSMYYNTVDRYWVGDTPKGVPYLTEMISHMPNLSYLDLGYYLTDDVKEEIDLVEEIARTWGYNKIPSTIPPVTSLGGWGGIHVQEILTRELLTSYGAMEVLTYTLISSNDLDLLNMPLDSELRNGIKVSNPMSEDHVMLRTTMLPSILKVISTNVNRKNDNVNVFEIGKIFNYTEILKNSGSMEKGTKPAIETKILAGGITGSRVNQSWLSKTIPYDFYDAKGMIEGLFAEIGVCNVQFVKSLHYALHPGRTCDVKIDDIVIGYLGELHPSVAENYGVPKRTYVYELNYEKLVEKCSKVIKYRPIPKYPAVQRDIAILVNKDICVQDVESKISVVGGELIESVKLFDVYEGAQVAQGMRSLAFSVTYRAADRTLTDEEVEKVHSKVVSALEETYSASLR